MHFADAFAAVYREQPLRYATDAEMLGGLHHTTISGRFRGGDREAESHDRLPSLVFADHLDETDRPHHATFVREAMRQHEGGQEALPPGVFYWPRAAVTATRVTSPDRTDFKSVVYAIPLSAGAARLSLWWNAGSGDDGHRFLAHGAYAPHARVHDTLDALEREGADVREAREALAPYIGERPTRMSRDGDPAIARKLNSKHQRNRAERNRKLTPAELAERIRALVAKRPRSTSQLQSSLRLDATAAKAAIEHGERAGLLRTSPTTRGGGRRVEPHGGTPPHTDQPAAAKYALAFSGERAVRYAAYRAPEGGVAVKGVYYPGGQLVPDLQKFAAGTPKPTLRERLRALLKRKSKGEQPLRYAKPVADAAAWQPHPTAAGWHTTRFSVPGGSSYYMVAKPAAAAGRVSVSFNNTSVNGPEANPTGVTGTGQSHAVFKHVADRVSGYLHAKTPPALHFGADETPSRQRLYRAAVARAHEFHPDYVGFHRTTPSGRAEFAMVHKDHAADFDDGEWERAEQPKRKSRAASLADAFAEVVRYASGDGRSREAFLNAIENAYDDGDHLPSLVFADWLEENEMPTAATHVRRVAAENPVFSGKPHAVDFHSPFHEGRQSKPGDTYVSAYPRSPSESVVSLRFLANGRLKGGNNEIGYHLSLPHAEAAKVLAEMHDEGVRHADSERVGIERHLSRRR